MPATHRKGDAIGTLDALSIGIGGIIGGGFFATFGLAIIGSRGSTPLSFLVGGTIALLTAYSYTRLTLRYPGPGGTVAFVRLGFGSGILASAVNLLLVWSYIAVMAVYARALSSYAVSYLPPADRALWGRVVASVAIALLALANFANPARVERILNGLNVGKIAILLIFILGGLTLGHPTWSRLAPANWVPAEAAISSGMVAFLAYEGFELVANCSNRVVDPERALPVAFFGSVMAAIVIYVLAVIVAVGHLSFDAMKEAKDFGISAAAATFMGPFGFGLMTLGAILASASAIDSDFFGAGKLPILLAEQGQMPRVFERKRWGVPVASLISMATIAILAVNFLDLQALSAATSGGFLIVFAAVNLANVKLAAQTKSHAWIATAGTLACVLALVVMLLQFASDPATRTSAHGVVASVAISILLAILFRLVRADERRPNETHDGRAQA